MNIYRTWAAATRAIRVMHFLNQLFNLVFRYATRQRQQVARLLAPRIAVVTGRIGLSAEQNE